MSSGEMYGFSSGWRRESGWMFSWEAHIWEMGKALLKWVRPGDCPSHMHLTHTHTHARTHTHTRTELESPLMPHIAFLASHRKPPPRDPHGEEMTSQNFPNTHTHTHTHTASRCLHRVIIAALVCTSTAAGSEVTQRFVNSIRNPSLL